MDNQIKNITFAIYLAVLSTTLKTVNLENTASVEFKQKAVRKKRPLLYSDATQEEIDAAAKELRLHLARGFKIH